MNKECLPKPIWNSLLSFLKANAEEEYGTIKRKR